MNLQDGDQGQGDSPVYAIEFTDPAQAEADAAYLSLSRYSLDFAERWYRGLFSEVQKLAILPNRCPLAPENSHFQNVTVRHLLYRRGRATYRIVYYVTDADGDGQEDMVRILHVRHGTQSPQVESTEDDEQET